LIGTLSAPQLRYVCHQLYKISCSFDIHCFDPIHQSCVPIWQSLV